MKTRWMRGTMFVILLAALFGSSSTRCEAAQARHWPVWTNVNQTGGELESNQVVQYLLRAHGYKIAADGQWGKQTERALAAFQRRRGLDVDGRIVDGPTWEALIIPLRRGSRGDAVRAVQTYMETKSQDGIYGAETEARVREMQRFNHLKVDGVLGRYSWCEFVGGAVGNQKIEH